MFNFTPNANAYDQQKDKLPVTQTYYLRGQKRYQMGNHQGSVVALVSDKHIAESMPDTDDDGFDEVDYYEADIHALRDYYPYGMVMPGRSAKLYATSAFFPELKRDADATGLTPFAATNWRFGFQGMEQDAEVKGRGNSINYKYRMHDPRVGRFLSLDPLAPEYPHNSPYAFSENRVIDGVELEGLEWESKNKWSDQASDEHLRNFYLDDWESHKGITYEEMYRDRAMAIGGSYSCGTGKNASDCSGQQGCETFDCKDFVFEVLINFAYNCRLPVHFEDYRRENSQPVLDNDEILSSGSYVDQDGNKVSVGAGDWKALSNALGTAYAAATFRYHGNKFLVMKDKYAAQNGDIAAIKNDGPGSYHAVTLGEVTPVTETKFTQWGRWRGLKGITTVVDIRYRAYQATTHRDPVTGDRFDTVPEYRTRSYNDLETDDSYGIDNIKTVSWNFDVFDSHK